MDARSPVLHASGPVLLIECINADQFPGRIAYLYPLIAGWFTATGSNVRWVRFGISTINLMRHERDEITLDNDEFTWLLAVVAEHRPALLLLTDHLYAEQMQALRRAAPQATLHVMARDLTADPLEAARPQMEAHPSLVPRYDFEPGNAAARERKHDNIYLLLPGSCGHRQAVANNPLYAGIDDERVQGHGGCAFCESGRQSNRVPGALSIAAGSAPRDAAGPGGMTTADWLRIQIQAVASNRRTPDRFPNALLLERVVNPLVLGQCLQWMHECGLAGHVQLLLAMRADQAQRLERSIPDHFSRFPDSKMVLGVYSSGVESFAGMDLLRFNKGTTPLDGLRAVGTLRELADRYPQNFWYSGLSLILFTPWTTPETLHLNVGLARLMELTRKETGNMFQARLRLHSHLPITCLAERDGLTVDSEPDNTVIMNRRKLFGRETAWRFGDERMRPLSRIVLRYDLLEEGEDPLSAAILGHLREANPLWTSGSDLDLLDFLLCKIDVVRSADVVLGELDLLDRAARLWAQRRAWKASHTRTFRIGEAVVGLAELVTQLAPLVQGGLKDLLSIDHIAAADVDAEVERVLARTGLPYAHVEDAWQATGQHGMLLLARDRATLGRAQALLAQMRNPHEELLNQAGRLHGVPECCARAFAAQPAAQTRHHAWSVLAQRSLHAGAIPTDLMPLWVPSLTFVPCTADCAAATQTYATWWRALGTAPPTDTNVAHIVTLTDDAEDELVSVTTQGMDLEQMRYDPAALNAGNGELRAWLRRGDALRVVPGQLQILKENRVIEVRTATHALWSPARALDPQAALALAHAVNELARKRPRQLEDRSLRLTRLARQGLAAALHTLGERAGDLSVQDVVCQVRDSEITLTVQVKLAGTGYTLSLADARTATRFLFRSQYFAVTQPPTDARQVPAEHEGKLRLLVLAYEALARRESIELLPDSQPQPAQPAEAAAPPEPPPPALPTGKRLLLLEFVTEERWVHDSRLYPFIQGLAQHRAWQVQWLTMGTRILVEQTATHRVSQVVELTLDDLQRLADAIAVVQPTHVVTSHPLPRAALDLLHAGGARLLSTSDHPPPLGVTALAEQVRQAAQRRLGSASAVEPEATVLWRQGRLGRSLELWRVGRTGWLLDWLGEEGPDVYFVGGVRPSYKALTGNDKARNFRPHLLLLGGVSCDHTLPVAQDPHFQGVDLSACDQDFGCAFCSTYRGPSSDLEQDAVAAAELQLRQVAADALTASRWHGVFDVLDARLFKHIERFATMVLDLALPPSTFCFEPRIDRVLEVADALERLLPRFAAAGHRILLLRLGIENLDEVENARLGKQISLSQFDAAAARMAHMVQEHPESFGCDPTWAYLTCSPWTTLENFATSLERAIERNFEPLGIWLYTPVLLYASTPLTRLAETQGGILRPDFDDASLIYEPSVNNCALESLIPWRFRDARMAQAFALVVRFCAAALRGKYSDAVFQGDATYEKLLGEEDLSLTRPDLFAREVVAAARIQADDREALLDAALLNYRERVAELAAVAAFRAGQGAPGEPRPAERPQEPAFQTDARAARMRQLIEAMAPKLAPALGGFAVHGVRAGAGELVLDVEVSGGRYELQLRDVVGSGPCFFATTHFAVSHGRHTPVRTQQHQQRLKRFVEVLDATAARHAPDLLPRQAP